VKIQKSFINGEWKAITSIPKGDYKRAKAAGLTGENMIGELSHFRKKSYATIRANAKNAQRQVDADKPWDEDLKPFKHSLADKSTVHHPATGDQHPAIVHAGNKRYARGLSEENLSRFMQSDKWGGDRAEAASKFGEGPTSMKAEDVIAHEAAHARPRRRKIGAQMDRSIRAMERGIKDTSKEKQNPNFFQFEGGINENAGKHKAALQTREEAHADVLASQHQGKPVVSSHWKEPNYLGDRNMIARGMKQPELKELKIPAKTNYGTRKTIAVQKNISFKRHER
jgi:hypothetical protein